MQQVGRLLLGNVRMNVQIGILVLRINRRISIFSEFPPGIVASPESRGEAIWIRGGKSGRARGRSA